MKTILYDMLSQKHDDLGPTLLCDDSGWMPHWGWERRAVPKTKTNKYQDLNVWDFAPLKKKKKDLFSIDNSQNWSLVLNSKTLYEWCCEKLEQEETWSMFTETIITVFMFFEKATLRSLLEWIVIIFCTVRVLVVAPLPFHEFRNHPSHLFRLHCWFFTV